MVKKVHFVNLNALRFIAAFLVIIAHTEQIKLAKGGKISYGIYMYHVLVINIVITTLSKWNLIVLSYPVILVLVILLSALSYNFITAYFLMKKKKYAVIATG